MSRITQPLKNVGFGILTEIDIKSTLKKEVDVDFRNYRIPEACNPPFAKKALKAEDKAGKQPPCNVSPRKRLIAVLKLRPSIRSLR